MKRSKHSLSHYKLATFDMGELVPVGLFEVLPGDSVQQHTSALVRCSPLLAPVMHPVSVRIHHWFVPNRLVWDGWESFITGGKDGQGDGTVFPTVTWAAAIIAGEVPDYMGVPVGVTGMVTSALPFRCYNLIYNEFYRDQDLINERAMSTGGGNDTVTNGRALARVSWEKDYFSSARPWPQKGPEVTLPIGTYANVLGDNQVPAFNATDDATMRNLSFLGAQNTVSYTGAPYTGTGLLKFGSPTGLIADLSTATGVDINTVRRMFAIQRLQEARAMYGSRYTEYLRYLGINSSDARLQRPEYLGGGKQTISFSEVLRTGNETAGVAPAVIGEMKGHGIAAMRSRPYRRFFEEHGHVLSLMSVRPRTMYVEGLEKMWNRRTKEDYWQKELELIGAQEVANKEIYAAGPAPDDPFGYQDRYAEYRHNRSSVAADFRATLNFWHLARDFAAAPVLNQSFVECDPGKRIFAEQTEDSLWVMVNHSIRARRLVGRPGVGRII